MWQRTYVNMVHHMKDRFLQRIDSLLKETVLCDTATIELNELKVSLKEQDIFTRKELEYFENNIRAYEMLLQFL